jgi:hypothetical protein
MYTLARIVRTATTVAVALIVAGIVIHLVGANTSNGVIKVINDAAKWLVQPFHDVFHLQGAKANVAVNWGIAAVVYALVGGLIARLLARAAMGPAAGRPLRRTRAV